MLHTYSSAIATHCKSSNNYLLIKKWFLHVDYDERTRRNSNSVLRFKLRSRMLGETSVWLHSKYGPKMTDFLSSVARIMYVLWPSYPFEWSCTEFVQTFTESVMVNRLTSNVNSIQGKSFKLWKEVLSVRRQQAYRRRRQKKQTKPSDCTVLIQSWMFNYF